MEGASVYRMQRSWKANCVSCSICPGCGAKWTSRNGGPCTTVVSGTQALVPVSNSRRADRRVPPTACLGALNARAGNIGDHEVVMPVNLLFHEDLPLVKSNPCAPFRSQTDFGTDKERRVRGSQTPRLPGGRLERQRPHTAKGLCRMEARLVHGICSPWQC